jgi:hypothetical protein
MLRIISYGYFIFNLSRQQSAFGQHSGRSATSCCLAPCWHLGDGLTDLTEIEIMFVMSDGKGQQP